MFNINNKTMDKRSPDPTDNYRTALFGVNKRSQVSTNRENEKKSRRSNRKKSNFGSIGSILLFESLFKLKICKRNLHILQP